RLQQIKAFPLRNTLDDVDQYDVGQFLRGDPVCGGGAYVASTDNRDFLAHSLELLSIQGKTRADTEDTKVTEQEGHERYQASRTRTNITSAFLSVLRVQWLAKPKLLHALCRRARPCCQSCGWRTRWS